MFAVIYYFEVTKMKKDIFIMFGICLTLLLGYNMTNETEVLDTNHTQVVTVNNGDTLWTIASQITTANIDVRQTVYAMNELNQLDTMSTLKPGTKIIVPTIKKVNPVDAKDYLAQN